MPNVGEMDLNGNDVTPEAGQSETTPESKEEKEVTEVTKDETKVETDVETVEKSEDTKEDIEALPQWAKDKLEKVESDKDNYKKGMLKYKGLTLDKKETKEATKDESEEEIYPDWDEDSKKFQKQTLSKVEERATATAMSIIEKANEKAAIATFIGKNQELSDVDAWGEVVANYNPRNGKETQQDIINDLEEALVITRYRKGELGKSELDAEERGRKKGQAESQVADLSSVAKTDSKTIEEDGNTVSDSALKMAERMRVDPEDLAKEDDSSIAEIKY